ncbi:MAG TPA: GNAT family N-acetyltransferase [Candidatus Saccharimonadales bacterium]|nr:GNAT family N-acetyltransferase [Candidatus Saccharimonadales bacterium]
MCRRRRPSRSSASPNTPEPDYDFPPLTEADLPLIRRWLLEPHVSRWWADPPRDTYPEDELDKYRQRLRGEGDPTEIFFIRHRGRPIGFIQSYLIDDYDEYGQALALDTPSAGIDLFIGEPAEIGKGHGPRLIRAFLRDVVFARYDVAECVIGPSVKNTSAIRAYEKAGFRFFRDAPVPDEPDPEHLMRIRRDEVTVP